MKRNFYPISEETREKMRISHLGKKMSIETRRRMSESAKKSGNGKWMLGRKFKKESLEKRSKSISGEKSFRWIPDRSKLKRYIGCEERRSPAYKFWRNEVFKRDNRKCKISNFDCCGRIEIHHILGFKEYPELKYDINNGITLCHFHHPRKRVEEINLSPYFQKLVAELE